MSEPSIDGGPAFPSTRGSTNQIHAEGMTLRDYFAGQALSGLVAQADERTCRFDGEQLDQWRDENHKNDAEHCYRLADAMLKARKK